MTSVERLEPFDSQRFVREFWQRRPCLISGWFQPQALTLAELLDVADAQQLPTRLITGAQERADWTLAYGPLDPSDLPNTDGNWTVLVQEMDKASRQVERILPRFRQFLPDWMVDDIMISHAMPGGSVGAHVDAYDVFLVQASGTRRWQLASRFEPQLDERFELALLRNWQPETELLVGPGEVLYLPAGIAHHGVAEDQCQTWSVGLRTPSGPELIFFLAESLVSRDRHGARLKMSHPDQKTAARITPELIEQARRLMEQALAVDDDQLAVMLGQFLSSWRLWTRDDPGDDIETITERLRDKASIALDAAARIALIGPSGQERLYVNGEAIACTAQMATRLALTRQVDGQWLNNTNGLDQLMDCGALSTAQS